MSTNSTEFQNTDGQNTGSAAPQAYGAATKHRSLNALTSGRRALRAYATELTVAGALVVLMLAVGGVRPEALTTRNYNNILQAAIPLIILALGELLVVITAGIDLSVGSVFSVSAMVAAKMLHNGHGVEVAVAAGLGTGLVFGAFNGLMVAWVRLAPFVVTLVSYAVAASLAFIVTNGNSVSLSNQAFASIYAGHLVPGLPNYVLIVAVLFALFHVFLSRLVPGRWFYATGTNARSARLVGVPVRATTFTAYAVSGLCASLAAILSISYLGNAQSTAGAGTELAAIAAVVIGGASLFGGAGTAIGAVLGGLIITSIQNAVNLLGINSFYQGTVTGAVILVAVLADRFAQADKRTLLRLFQRQGREGP